MKLKGSAIYVAEDYDKEAQSQRKEMIQMRNKFRESGKSCKLRRSGLIVNGKFISYQELVKGKEGEESGGEDVEDVAEDVNGRKKRKRIKKNESIAPESAVMKELFRPRSDSTSSVSSIKK